MGEPFASGNWHVMEGKEQEFIERWREWLGWTRETQPALQHANLVQNESDPRHFISFAQWEDAASRNAWKQSEEFAQKFGAVRALCEEFHGGDYERVVAV